MFYTLPFTLASRYHICLMKFPTQFPTQYHYKDTQETHAIIVQKNPKTSTTKKSVLAIWTVVKCLVT